MKTKLGNLVQVENKGRKFGSNNVYYAVHTYTDGEVVPLLLTQEEYRIAMNRARQNKEDLPKVHLTWFQKIFNLWK